MVELLQAALLVWTLFRRRDRIACLLCTAFILETLAADFRSHETLRPILMAVDAYVVVFASYLASRYDSTRARIIAAISLSAIAFSILAAATGMRWNTYAAAANGAVFVQILVAGGFANGFLAWLGNSTRVFVKRGHRVSGGWR